MRYNLHTYYNTACSIGLPLGFCCKWNNLGVREVISYEHTIPNLIIQSIYSSIPPVNELSLDEHQVVVMF